MKSLKLTLAASLAMTALTATALPAQDISTMGRVPPAQKPITLKNQYESQGQVKTSGTDRSNWFMLTVNLRAKWYTAKFRDGDICGAGLMDARITNRDHLTLRFRAGSCTSGSTFTEDVVKCRIRLADAGVIQTFGRVKPEVPVLVCRYFDKANKSSDHFMMLPTR